MKKVVGTIRVVAYAEGDFAIFESVDGTEYSLDSKFNVEVADDDTATINQKDIDDTQLYVGVINDRKTYSKGYKLPVDMTTLNGAIIKKGTVLENRTVLKRTPKLISFSEADAFQIEMHQAQLDLLKAQADAAQMAAGI